MTFARRKPSFIGVDQNDSMRLLDWVCYRCVLQELSRFNELQGLQDLRRVIRNEGEDWVVSRQLCESDVKCDPGVGCLLFELG